MDRYVRSGASGRGKRGQCKRCKIVWVWHTKLLVKDASCLECQRPLQRCTMFSGYGYQILQHRDY